MYKRTLKLDFEDFCKGLINEQDILIASGQLFNNIVLMAQSKMNPNRIFF